MKKRMDSRNRSKGDLLRERAEKILSQNPEAIRKIPIQDITRLIHEPEVHQVELDMQNDELRKAQAEVELSRAKYVDLYDFAPVGYFTLTPTGKIEEVNLTGAKLLGVEKTNLVNRDFRRFIATEFRKLFDSHRSEVLTSDSTVKCELRLTRRASDPLDVSLESLSVKSGDGNVSLIRSAIIDIIERKRAGEELQKAHAELLETSKAAEGARKYAESIVETIREPLLVLSPDLRVISANRTFYETFKVAQEETLGRYIYDLGNRQWDIPSLRQLLEDILPKNTAFENFEVDHEFPTIGRRTMLLNARRIHEEEEVTRMILLVFEDITERKLAGEALRKAHDQVRFFASQCLTAQETERKRIAGEIHDSIGASLAATKFKVEDVITKVGENRPKTRDALGGIVPMLQEVIQEARRIQLALRPSMLDDLGILATINWFCRQFESTYSHIHIGQEINIEESEVPVSLRIIIFRLLQEALNNIAKHSKADRVNLVLRKMDSGIELRVQDNGQGFDTEEPISRLGTAKGLGLDSMRERAELSGGFFSIESSKGSGTVIRATWPLNS